MRTFRFIMILTLVMALGLVGIAAAQDEVSARPWIGVTIGDADAGVLVIDIAPDSPAASSDLAVDDVIVTLNGEDASTISILIDRLSEFSPEDSITLGILRDGDAMDIDITLGEFPEELQIVPGDEGGPQITRRINVLPMLGVVFNAVDEGWQVTEVLPFAQASFEEGDIITAINGEDVEALNMRELMSSLMQDEGTVEVTVLRAGEEMTIEIESLDILGDLGAGTFTVTGNRVVLGVRYRALDEAFATNLGIDTTEGALITEVLDDTPAAAAELMDGDIVIAVNDTAIDSQNDLSAIIRDFEDGDTVTLTVLRAGEEITLDVTLEVQDIGGQSIEIRPGGRIEGRRGLDPDGRGFGFRFDGDDFNFEDLEDFFDGFDGIEGFEGVLPPGASLSLTCQNSDGDTVFSFVFSGSDGFDIQNFQLPEMGDDGFDFESLDCQVNSDAPPAESGNGDL